MKPVAANPNTSFKDLIDGLKVLEKDRLSNQITALIAKLQRKSKRVSIKALSQFKYLTDGKSPEETARFLKSSPTDEAVKFVLEHEDDFTINRARQYGKTTTLNLLAQKLQDEYYVLSLDFQAIGNASFATEEKFVKAFCRLLKKKAKKANIPNEIQELINEILARKDELAVLDELFDVLTQWFDSSEKAVVLIIDEVDSASNNQVFLDFLAQLRLMYLERKMDS